MDSPSPQQQSSQTAQQTEIATGLEQQILERRGFSKIEILAESDHTTTLLCTFRDGRKWIGSALFDKGMFLSGKAEEVAGDFHTAVTVQHAFDHERIPRCYGFDEFSDYAVRIIWRDYIEGESLAEVIERERKLGISEIKSLMQDVTEILTYIHNPDLNGLDRPVIHSDIKPSNIYRDEDGRFHLADFGVARQIIKNQTYEHTQCIRGTRGYLPLEASINGDTRQQSDLYSLGVTAIECLRGYIPDSLVINYQKERPYMIPEAWSLPPKFRAVLQQMIHPDMEKRQQSAEELLKQLQDKELLLDEKYQPAGFTLRALTNLWDKDITKHRRLNKELERIVAEGLGPVTEAITNLRNFQDENLIPVNEDQLKQALDRYTETNERYFEVEKGRKLFFSDLIDNKDFFPSNRNKEAEEHKRALYLPETKIRPEIDWYIKGRNGFSQSGEYAVFPDGWSFRGGDRRHIPLTSYPFYDEESPAQDIIHSFETEIVRAYTNRLSVMSSDDLNKSYKQMIGHLKDLFLHEAPSLMKPTRPTNIKPHTLIARRFSDFGDALHDKVVEQQAEISLELKNLRKIAKVAPEKVESVLSGEQMQGSLALLKFLHRDFYKKGEIYEQYINVKRLLNGGERNKKVEILNKWPEGVEIDKDYNALQVDKNPVLEQRHIESISEKTGCQPVRLGSTMDGYSYGVFAGSDRLVVVMRYVEGTFRGIAIERNELRGHSIDDLELISPFPLRVIVRGSGEGERASPTHLYMMGDDERWSWMEFTDPSTPHDSFDYERYNRRDIASLRDPNKIASTNLEVLSYHDSNRPFLDKHTFFDFYKVGKSHCVFINEKAENMVHAYDLTEDKHLFSRSAKHGVRPVKADDRTFYGTSNGEEWQFYDHTNDIELSNTGIDSHQVSVIDVIGKDAFVYLRGEARARVFNLNNNIALGPLDGTPIERVVPDPKRKGCYLSKFLLSDGKEIVASISPLSGPW